MNAELRVLPDLGIVFVALSNLDPPAATRLMDFFLRRIDAPTPTPAAPRHSIVLNLTSRRAGMPPCRLKATLTLKHSSRGEIKELPAFRNEPHAITLGGKTAAEWVAERTAGRPCDAPLPD